MRLLRPVALEDLGDPKDRERLASLGGDERHRVGAAEPVGAVLVDGKGDGDRPGQPVLEVHRLEDRVVVGLALEPREGRERADREHLEVGELALGDDERGEVAGLIAERVGVGPLREELHEGSPVWIDSGHDVFLSMRSDGLSASAGRSRGSRIRVDRVAAFPRAGPG